MTSYFRYFFGGNQSKNPDHPAMLHSRSRPNPTPDYFYGPPAGSPSRLKTKRSNSFSTQTATSPLRYNSFEAAAGDMKQGTPLKARNAPLYRRASYKSSEHLHYPLHTPRGPSVSFGERRPSLRQNHNSISSATESGHSYTANGMDYGARAPLHMHPLFAATRLHSAPINYDVMFAPSSRTVVDRVTHSPVPAHTLSQPATDPPTPPSSRIVLRSDKFPWPVIVGANSSPGSSFGSPAKNGRSPYITNLDLLYALHSTLATRVTPQEWDALGHGSRAQRKVTRAYEKRCTIMGGGWEGGVRRVDWLHGKTRLIGIEVEKYGSGVGSGKLIFGKA